MPSFKPYEIEESAKNDFSLKSLFYKREEAFISLFGYPDDEGIKANGGKAGSALGPDAIRKSLYKMTPTKKMKDLALMDGGNLKFAKDSLEERHNFAISHLLENKKEKTITFGGGHDYGYVDGAAFLKSSQEAKPLIINFDAHFDLRNLEKGITSGTPFYRLIENFKERDFDLLEVGIQKQCNSTHLHDYAQNQKKITTFYLEDLYPNYTFSFKKFKEAFSKINNQDREAFISVDIDSFSSAIAPGCSQSWPSGFHYEGFFQIFDFLLENLNVTWLGVYEVSPPLDHNEQTSRLASLIAYRYLESCAL